MLKLQIYLHIYRRESGVISNKSKVLFTIWRENTKKICIWYSIISIFNMMPVLYKVMALAQLKKG